MLPLPEPDLWRDDGQIYATKEAHDLTPMYEKATMRAHGAAARRAALLEAAELLADDASAISYQTMGQYRTALIRALRERANG